MYVEHFHSENERETVAKIEGLERPLILVHITDSHMAEADQRDPRALESVAKIQKTFEEHTPNGESAREVFVRTIKHCERLSADCTILTGDIIHFPARAALDAIANGVDSLKGQYLYTLGNHDWHFPYLQWNDDTRNAHYYLFADLTGGNPAAQVLQLAGVRLVALDNSNYQVTPGQLKFLRDQLHSGDPCLLFLHIPLYVPSLAPAVIERWKVPIMMAAPGWTEETRKQVMIRPDDESTTACLRLLAEGDVDNLVGIFCGHVHFAHTDQLGPGCFQYVTQPGFAGGYREIRLQPAT